MMDLQKHRVQLVLFIVCIIALSMAENYGNVENGELNSNFKEDPLGWDTKLLDSQQHVGGIMLIKDFSHTQISYGTEAERSISCISDNGLIGTRTLVYDSNYGQIKISRTIQLSSSPAHIKHKLRYTINGVSYVPMTTTLRSAGYFKIHGIFRLGNIPDTRPAHHKVHLSHSVMDTTYRTFIEIMVKNKENSVQSWHLDGYNFWVVGYVISLHIYMNSIMFGSYGDFYYYICWMDIGRWSPASRRGYNLQDAMSRSTTQRGENNGVVQTSFRINDIFPLEMNLTL